MIVFLNGQFIDSKDAFIGINDLSIQRGFGIFDFFRTRKSVPLFLEDHLDRFFHSAEMMRLLPGYSRDHIKEVIFEMIERNNLETSGFKLLLTGGYSADGYEVGIPNFIVTQQPVEIAPADKIGAGIKIILHPYLRDVPTAKSTNYMMAIFLRDKVVKAKADDVLYYSNDRILEFPRSNVFIVKEDKTVVTPAENVLAGITRKKVIQLAGKHFTIEVRDVTVDELKNASEIFLTSTTKRLLPVIEMDGKLIGNGHPGIVTSALHKLFVELENDYFEENTSAVSLSKFSG